MWLGLLYFTAADAPGMGGDTVVICAWKAGRERPLTFAGPREAASEIMRLVRSAASSCGSIRPPRCDACGTALELPLD